MASQATRRRILADVRRRIDEFGWAVQTVGRCCSVPGRPGGGVGAVELGYTVGLTRYDGHPDLVITGVAQMETGHPLNLLGERVRAGERLAHGDTVHGTAADRPVRLVAVPWQPGCHVADLQPLLGMPGG